jgi:DNA-binding GntR family transcriptional regulator
VTVPAPDDAVRYSFEKVRELILRGDLAPGAWISQVQLAARLRVSRTPLREALRRLENEGLVQLDFNRRVRVSPLSIPDLESLYAMRIVTEPFAMRLSVPRLTADDLAHVENCLGRMKKAVDDGDEHAVLEPHRDFHFSLFQHVSERLRLQVEAMWEHAVRYVRIYHNAPDYRLSLIAMARGEHEAIYRAARCGDGNHAARLTAQHLTRTALTVVASVAPAHNPESVREALSFVLDAAPESVGTPAKRSS